MSLCFIILSTTLFSCVLTMNPVSEAEELLSLYLGRPIMPPRMTTATNEIGGMENTGSPPVHETYVKAWKKALILWKKTRTFKVIDWIQELDWVTPPPLCSKQEVQTRLRHLTVVLNKLNVYCKKCRIQLSNSYWPVWFILNIVASLLLTDNFWYQRDDDHLAKKLQF